MRRHIWLFIIPVFSFISCGIAGVSPKVQIAIEGPEVIFDTMPVRLQGELEIDDPYDLAPYYRKEYKWECDPPTAGRFQLEGRIAYSTSPFFIPADVDEDTQITLKFLGVLSDGNTLVAELPLLIRDKDSSDDWEIRWGEESSPFTPGFMDKILDARMDANGDILICGININGFYLKKLDPDGNLIWLNELGSEEETTYNGKLRLAVDDAGNSYCAGYFWPFTPMSAGSSEFQLPFT